MKRALLIAGIAMCLIGAAGCYHNNIKKLERYENGNIKSDYSDTSTGFDAKWSSGDGKVLNLPGSHISGVAAK